MTRVSKQKLNFISGIYTIDHMSENLLDTIVESEEQFNLALINIKQEIKLEFLSMAKKNRQGFFISLQIAFKWLRIKYPKDHHSRKNINVRILQPDKFNFKEAKDENDFTAHFIYRNTESDSRIKVPWFSDKGFKFLCMCMSKSPKAALVREYYLELEEEYIKILEMNAKQRDEFITSLNTRINNYDKENKNLEETIDKKNKIIGNLLNQQHVLNHMKEKYASTADMFKNHYDEIDPDDQTLSLRLGLYERAHGKPIHIYLVSDDWVNNLIIKKASKKKSSKEIKSVPDDVDDQVDTDNVDDQDDAMTELIKSKGLVIYKDDMEDLEFQDITLSWIKDYILSKDHTYSEQQFYFHLTKKANADSATLKYWDTIYFFNDAHYNEFMTRIENIKLSAVIPEVATHKSKMLKEIYLTQYESIANAHKEVASQIAFRTKYPKDE